MVFYLQIFYFGHIILMYNILFNYFYKLNMVI